MLNGNSNIFHSIGHVARVDDVIEDANNTFIKEMNYEMHNEQAHEESQMDLIMKHDQAFNWQEGDEIKLRLVKSNKKKVRGGFVKQIKDNIQKGKYIQRKIKKTNSHESDAEIVKSPRI